MGRLCGAIACPCPCACACVCDSYVATGLRVVSKLTTTASFDNEELPSLTLLDSAVLNKL